MFALRHFQHQSLCHGGVQSFSHVVARRIGFSGLPLSTLVLSHLLHANLACQAGEAGSLWDWFGLGT